MVASLQLLLSVLVTALLLRTGNWAAGTTVVLEVSVLNGSSSIEVLRVLFSLIH